MIGLHIGANNVPLAKRYTRVIFCVSLACSCIIALVMLAGRRAIIDFFTSDPEVINLCLSVFPNLLVSVLVIIMMSVFQGGIRGLGM